MTELDWVSKFSQWIVIKRLDSHSELGNLKLKLHEILSCLAIPLVKVAALILYGALGLD